MVSVKKNFIYSSILTTANILFPLIVFPYVSRVLGVANIGLCNFVNSVIDYFVLFSALGINVLGIREVAASKANKEELNRVFSSLLFINAMASVLMLLVLIGVTLFVSRLHEHWPLMLIGAFKLMFNLLLIEWFFKGLEEFRYITLRTLVVRVLYVIFIFLLVRKESDYPFYFLLTTLMIVVNAVINIIYSQNFVSFSLKEVNFNKYLKPYTELGLYRVLTSMYTSFNVAFLGFVSSDSEVGFYSTAIKLYTISLSLFSAFTGVMMPRMSNLFAENDMVGFKGYISKSYNFLFAMVIPLIVLLTINADGIITIISGKGYEGAVLPMQIVMPLMLIVGTEQILIEQVLMPMKKDHTVTINAIVGASIGVVLNMLLVPKLHSVGSAIVIASSEFAIFLLAIIEVKKYLGIRFPIESCIKQCLVYLPMIIVQYVVILFVDNKIISFFINGVILLIYYLLAQRFVIKTVDVIAETKNLFRRN